MKRVLVIFKSLIVERKLIGNVLSLYEKSGFYVERLKVIESLEFQDYISNKAVKKSQIKLEGDSKICVVIFQYKDFIVNASDMTEKLKLYLNTKFNNTQFDEMYIANYENTDTEIEAWFPELKSKVAFKKENKSTCI